MKLRDVKRWPGPYLNYEPKVKRYAVKPVVRHRAIDKKTRLVF